MRKAKLIKIGGILAGTLLVIGLICFSSTSLVASDRDATTTTLETETTSKKQVTINEDIPQESEEVVCEENVTDTVYTTASLNVREKADISSTKVGILPKNAEITRVEDNDGWDAIEVAGVKYYVYDKYLTDTKPETVKKVTELLPVPKPAAPKAAATARKVTPSSDSRYELNVALSEEDVRTLAALVWLEGRGEPVECQKAIASVVLNRMMYHGSSLHNVVYAKNQFTPAQYIESTKANKDISTQVSIVNDICANGTTLPLKVLYFRSSYYFNWSTVSDYVCYGNTYFSILK